MRAGRLALRALLLLLLLVPAASGQACREAMMAVVGTEGGEIHTVSVYGGGFAKAIRSEADALAGDGDGRVEPHELAAYLQQWTFTAKEDHAHCLTEVRILTLDGHGPVQVHEVRPTAVDLQPAAADSGVPVRLRWNAGLTYDKDETTQAEAVVQLAYHPGLREAAECAYPKLRDWTWGDHVCGVAPDDPAAGETHVAAVPAGGHEILPATVEPHSLAETWHEGGLWAKSALERDTMARQPVSFIVQEQGPSALTVGVSAATAGAVALGLAVALPTSRRWLASVFFALPGFTRLSRSQALDNPLREELVERVRANPGLSLSDLQRQTEVPKGTLTHHLRMLERHRLLRREREGSRTRFYPRGPRVDRKPYLSRVQRRILRAVQDNPGLTQQALSLQLDVSRDVVAYNATRLEELGRLRVQKDGPRRRYLPAATKA